MEARVRHPGMGVVILSQYDDPEYAIRLMSEGSSGLAYLLKDRVADGRRLTSAIRTVASGGTMLDPEIARALVAPVQASGALNVSELQLLQEVVDGRSDKWIARAHHSTPVEADVAVERLLAQVDGLGGHRRSCRAPADQGAASSRSGPRGLWAVTRSTAACRCRGPATSGSRCLRPKYPTHGHRSCLGRAGLHRPRRRHRQSGTAPLGPCATGRHDVAVRGHGARPIGTTGFWFSGVRESRARECQRPSSAGRGFRARVTCTGRHEGR
jgi:hypothetical protein